MSSSDPGRRRPPGRPPARSPKSSGGAPVVRRGTVRLPGDIAAHVRAGHPWIYREGLGGRPLRERSGDVVELVAPAGRLRAPGRPRRGASNPLRVVSRDPRETVGPELWARRVKSALAVRKRYVAPDIDAIRLINAESDGLPAFTVDRYGDYLVAHVFSPVALQFTDPVYDALA